ncbi:uroporphyrinogen-III C-methyltransferase [Oxalobacter paraformigenes]|uniref:Uncharacterized protein n=1 Tax=Oxalobacter paraformigenes TaxID=556268 RepID=C3X715_9BURK|nr:uroporphyrinogen-III C-methyltransferase [Oxalobacter paraformigenes]EEO26928.1 hypothetical protein OFAG_00081 [Oxalobacter paraformigenes]
MNSTTDPASRDRTEPLKKTQRRLRFLSWALGITGLLFIAHLVYSHIEMRELRSEIARRLQTGDEISMEAKTLAKTTQDAVADLQSKVATLENQQAETQNQQISLSQMYQELSKSKDDWSLAEIEQVLSAAHQQLLLSKNINGALIALENADRLLAKSRKPQFIVLRAALAKDMERLRSVPHVDTTGMVLKLDAVIGEVDKLPLISDGKPLDRHEERESNGSKRQIGFSFHPADWVHASTVLWNDWIDDVWSEIHGLIQVQRVDSPEAMILSPLQTYYLRENLKLRLLGSRLSLLSSSTLSFKNDIDASLAILDRYFDTASEPVKAVKTTLEQLGASEISVEVTGLTESLAAIQRYRLQN